MSLPTPAPAPRQAALILCSLQTKITLAVATTVLSELAALRATGTGITVAVLEALECEVSGKIRRPGSLGRELQIRTLDLQ